MTGATRQSGDGGSTPPISTMRAPATHHTHSEHRGPPPRGARNPAPPPPRRGHPRQPERRQPWLSTRTRNAPKRSPPYKPTAATSAPPAEPPAYPSAQSPDGETTPIPALAKSPTKRSRASRKASNASPTPSSTP